MLGYRLQDIDLQNQTDFQRLRQAIPEHGVVVLKNQSLDVAQLVALTRRFGEPVVLPEGLRFNNIEQQHPEVARVSNILPDGTLLPGHRAAEYWHNDGDFWQPGRNYIFNLLHSKIVPQVGGQTGFVDLRAAYEQLPTDLKTELDDKHVLVCCDDIPDFKDALPEERQPDALHAVKHTHIETQRTGLYFGHAQAQLHSVPIETSKRIMAALVAAIEQPELQYVHEWEPGDLLIWDNTSVMHRGMGGYHDYPRLLYRTQAFVKPL